MRHDASAQPVQVEILQQLYSIADDQTEYMINDRLSFEHFLGLRLGSAVPDAKTIWNYRNKLAESGKSKALFDLFADMPIKKGVMTKTGSLVEASFADVPRQRNTREENQTIKNGKVPEEWRANTPAMKHKLAQKDTDARWAKKNG